MRSLEATAALVALLKIGRSFWHQVAEMVEEEEAPCACSSMRWKDKNLRTIHDLPPLLFFYGDLCPEDEQSTAIVGTRHPPMPAVSLRLKSPLT